MGGCTEEHLPERAFGKPRVELGISSITAIQSISLRLSLELALRLLPMAESPTHPPKTEKTSGQEHAEARALRHRRGLPGGREIESNGAANM